MKDTRTTEQASGGGDTKGSRRTQKATVLLKRRHTCPHVQTHTTQESSIKIKIAPSAFVKQNIFLPCLTTTKGLMVCLDILGPVLIPCHHGKKIIEKASKVSASTAKLVFTLRLCTAREASSTSKETKLSLETMSLLSCWYSKRS